MRYKPTMNQLKTIVLIVIALALSALTLPADAALRDARSPSDCFAKAGVELGFSDVYDESRHVSKCIFRGAGSSDTVTVLHEGTTTFADGISTCAPGGDCIDDWVRSNNSLTIVDTEGMTKREVDTPSECLNRAGMSVAEINGGVYISHLRQPDSVIERQRIEYVECLVRPNILEAGFDVSHDDFWVIFADGVVWCPPLASCGAL